MDKMKHNVLLVMVKSSCFDSIKNGAKQRLQAKLRKAARQWKHNLGVIIDTQIQRGRKMIWHVIV